jgi:hypothetical protein
VTDETVADLHLGRLEAGLAAAGIAMSARAAARRGHQGLAAVERCVEWLLGREDRAARRGGGASAAG